MVFEKVLSKRRISLLYDVFPFQTMWAEENFLHISITGNISVKMKQGSMWQRLQSPWIISTRYFILDLIWFSNYKNGKGKILSWRYLDLGLLQKITPADISREFLQPPFRCFTANNLNTAHLYNPIVLPLLNYELVVAILIIFYFLHS